MDKLNVYGQLGLAIAKLNAAMKNLELAGECEDIKIDSKFFIDELIYVTNNLAILQDKLKDS